MYSILDDALLELFMDPGHIQYLSTDDDESRPLIDHMKALAYAKMLQVKGDKKFVHIRSEAVHFSQALLHGVNKSLDFWITYSTPVRDFILWILLGRALFTQLFRLVVISDNAQNTHTDF